MKVAIIFNRESQSVINLFGIPNREKIGLETIKRISNALKDGGHNVVELEGDKDLIDKLEDFMPRVVKGERPGLAFNVSYGIQGQARYTHVPSILEMVGIPYVGSGPLAHSLALDKVVSKMIFRQHGLPTPDFAVLKDEGFPAPDLTYPLIVKPKNEAVSFGIEVVNNEAELRTAAQAIFDAFRQAVLCESYIEGRELNVGIIGNNPGEAFPPVELDFGTGPHVYSYEDKTRKSGREIGFKAPADVSADVAKEAQRIAVEAFSSLGCYDCSRVDLRLDSEDKVYLLEINSLPSMGEHGSYVIGAETVGLTFGGLVNRLVEVASSRYFGTPHPPSIEAKKKKPSDHAFDFLTQRRDALEKEVEQWVSVHSRSSDQVGIRGVANELGERFVDMAMKPVESLTDLPFAWTWETSRGLDGGTLLICQIDVPQESDFPAQGFRRDPERLFGEGIASSRAQIVSAEYALRALRHQRRLRTAPIGVLCYADEGFDCEYSSGLITEASKRAAQVLVMRPGGFPNSLTTQRRGLRKYRFRSEGEPRRLGGTGKRPLLMKETFELLHSFARLGSRKDRLAITSVELRSDSFPMMHAHAFEATVMLSYLDRMSADKAESQMLHMLRDGYKFKARLELLSDRPPMKRRRPVQRLAGAYRKTAEVWEIPVSAGSSVWPSPAGLVPSEVPVICGVGPVGRDLHTPSESIERLSLLQRTLLLAQFLVQEHV